MRELLHRCRLADILFGIALKDEKLMWRYRTMGVLGGYAAASGASVFRRNRLWL
jgi:hypothetical protein